MIFQNNSCNWRYTKFMEEQEEMEKREWRIVDEHGNIECQVCKKVQAPGIGINCIHCCSHDIVTLCFVPAHGGGYDIEYVCKNCNFEIEYVMDKSEIVANYLLVRKDKIKLDEI